ncbi:putative protein phosphatase 2C 12 [Tetrabaena socialis]|uniref:PPM-type phosphatase domain-containing protein n=1 Tax=Tetrabaena socialis TaxID=47790 RepID=A0A2J8AHT1_9CHLO|nr:putative protein phosphatase 2C 12 [Tetrabaena socialis]|eukprot:PNH12069.1 putative protein phosphatase 2C 12 [Tetrabaena socialis]
MLDAQEALFFGAFDGHGQNGGTVAALAAGRLPALVQQELNQGRSSEEALSSSFAGAHQFLLQQPGLDCSMSGCTAVVALLADDVLFVANAGDSRAIIGRFEGANTVAAYELSNDHSPCLMHEANRVLASGGRIAPFQLNGKRVGPPRVWERGADRPGLCITRSLGDTMAKRIGVTHTPELCRFPLTVDDRYLVLVSDGITEFLGSQDIIEKVHAWASVGTTPDDVARRLVREARLRWKAQDDGAEGIIDDCTALVAYLVYDPVEAPPEEARATASAKGRGKRGLREQGQQAAGARTWGQWAASRAPWVPWSAAQLGLLG